MLNKTISEDLLVQWMRECDEQLEYRNEKRESVEKLLYNPTEYIVSREGVIDRRRVK